MFRHRIISSLALALVALLALVQPGVAQSLQYDGYNVPYNSRANVQYYNSSGVKTLDINTRAGQILLTTTGGVVDAWCIDIFGVLQPRGVFTTGVLGTSVANSINALISNGSALMASTPSNSVSAAIQVAIWRTMSGVDPSVNPRVVVNSSDSTMLALVETYLGNVANGTWKADQTRQVQTLSPATGTSNQILARLIPAPSSGVINVPEPTSMALFSVGLLALAGARKLRRTTKA